MRLPFIYQCSQAKMRQILKDLRDGYTAKRAAEKHGVAVSTLSKYERIHANFGIEAFAKVSDTSQKIHIRRAQKNRAKA